MKEKPDGKLLADVVLTYPSKEEMLEFPTGTPIVEFLSKAAAAFGEGYIIDRDGRVTSEHAKLDGGYYTWRPDGSLDPLSLHVRQKRTGPSAQQHADYYLILGDPEIMRIFPDEWGFVSIDRTKLGDWGTKGKPVPLHGPEGSINCKPYQPAQGVAHKHEAIIVLASGWWGVIKELVAPPVAPPQP